ncbi:MAG TPA: riboflavin synthase [Sedimentisphaerales bacterium]|nr:riboflavin synthase [Sedimentisphaerales bacterium]HRS12264.1 riboflavin synthase [Sedimentisphaerales bacterium]HRV48853.1 riboflavin synthase [Sedimentisphaerales bacterium]
MFTGLIESVCQVRSLSAGRASEGGLLAVDLGALAEGCRSGDSLAISGACLTVTRLEGAVATFALSPETLAKSTLATLKPSSKVNVERAMAATARFGGHIVQGHVDGVGTVRAVKKLGEFADIEFGAPAEVLEQMVPKGSVAIDGVSLTIAGLGDAGFRVAAIPETLGRTTLGSARIGDKVNIEVDILVKIVRRQLECLMPKDGPLTVERLRQMGY